MASERFSANKPYFNQALVNNGTGAFAFPIEFSYEVDLWGRVRRSISSAKEEAQATAADLETAKLSLHAELARDYFELRSADLQKSLLTETVQAYERALHLTETRYNGGALPDPIWSRREPNLKPRECRRRMSRKFAPPTNMQ